MPIVQSRRKFLITLSGAVAAPAIVKADNLMKIVSVKETFSIWMQDVVNHRIYHIDNPAIAISHWSLINHDPHAGTIDHVASARWLKFKLYGKGWMNLAKKDAHLRAFEPIPVQEMSANLITKGTQWKPIERHVVKPDDTQTE
jgi:hypothetical protein